MGILRNKLNIRGLLKQSKLQEYDNMTGLSEKTNCLVKERGKTLTAKQANFGRAVNYYLPIHKLLHQFLGDVEGKTILHLAGSTGVLAKILQDEGATSINFDLDKDATEISRAVGNERVVRGQAGIQQLFLPFKDNSIDCFVSDHFLYSNYARLGEYRSLVTLGSDVIFRQLHRILRPGGVGLIYGINDKLIPNDAHFIMSNFEVISANIPSDPAGFVVLKKK